MVSWLGTTHKRFDWVRMPNIKNFSGFLIALSLGAYSAWVQADEDWLIAKVNGQWTWDSTGPEGRVRKNFLNQEVLRRTPDGLIVVVSALPIAQGETVTCSDKARRNPKDACSSGFLVCKSSGGAFSSLWGLFTHGAEGATDARISFSCAIDTDAVMEAAIAVGLVERSELDPPPSPDAAGSKN